MLRTVGREGCVVIVTVRMECVYTGRYSVRQAVWIRHVCKAELRRSVIV